MEFSYKGEFLMQEAKNSTMNLLYSLVLIWSFVAFSCKAESSKIFVISQYDSVFS